MNKSQDWSTNEIEERYSPKEIKTLAYFHEFRDPYSEFEGLARQISLP